MADPGWAHSGFSKNQERFLASELAARNPAIGFQGELRGNQTPASTTAPEAKLCRKGQGKEAKLFLWARS